MVVPFVEPTGLGPFGSEVVYDSGARLHLEPRARRWVVDGLPGAALQLGILDRRGIDKLPPVESRVQRAEVETTCGGTLRGQPVSTVMTTRRFSARPTSLSLPSGLVLGATETDSP